MATGPSQSTELSIQSLRMKGNGSRLDGKSRAGEILTVYYLQDWKVLYDGVRRNVPSELLRCPPGLEGYRD